jgi:hypothetical protein
MSIRPRKRAEHDLSLLLLVEKQASPLAQRNARVGGAAGVRRRAIGSGVAPASVETGSEAGALAREAERPVPDQRDETAL